MMWRHVLRGLGGLEVSGGSAEALRVIDSYFQGAGDAGIEIESETAPCNLGVACCK